MLVLQGSHEARRASCYRIQLLLLDALLSNGQLTGDQLIGAIVQPCADQQED